MCPDREASHYLASFAFTTVLLMGSMFNADAALARHHRQAAAAPPDLAARVNTLAKQLYGVPLDESEPLTSQIQNLVLPHIEEWLQQRVQGQPSDVDVRRELERVFAPI